MTRRRSKDDIFHIDVGVLSKNAPLPKHDHAGEHLLLIEMKKPPRRQASLLNLASGEIAARRIREVAWDLGHDLNHHRWMAHVARQLDIPYQTMRDIIHGWRPSVSTQTVDRVARKTNIPIAAFYDPHY